MAYTRVHALLRFGVQTYIFLHVIVWTAKFGIGTYIIIWREMFGSTKSKTMCLYAFRNSTVIIIWIKTNCTRFTGIDNKLQIANCCIMIESTAIFVGIKTFSCTTLRDKSGFNFFCLHENNINQEHYDKTHATSHKNGGRWLQRLAIVYYLKIRILCIFIALIQ